MATSTVHEVAKIIPRRCKPVKGSGTVAENCIAGDVRGGDLMRAKPSSPPPGDTWHWVGLAAIT